MTLAEALSEGARVTVLGLSIVFSVLIILMIVLMLFRVIFYKDPAKQAKQAAPAVQAAPAEAVKAEPAKDDMDEEELVAILTAAVAASLNTSTYNLQIKSYRRVGGISSAWNKAGVTETINNRF